MLISEINSTPAEKLTPLLLASWRREAKNVRSVSISDGDMLLGILASIEGKEAETRKRFINSLAYAGNNTGPIVYNYGQALLRLGLFGEAAQALLEMAELDKDCAELMFVACVALGLRAKAKYYYLKAGKPEDDFDKCYNTNKNTPSAARDMAFQAIHESFAREPKIWAELSKR